MLVKAVQVAIFNRVMLSQRIQLRRTKGWRMPANTLKVDRSTIFGNPFGSDARHASEAVAMFEDWLCDPHWDQYAGAAYAPLIVKQLSVRRRDLLAFLPNLRGYNLACWCSPAERGRTGSLPRDGAAEIGKRITSPMSGRTGLNFLSNGCRSGSCFATDGRESGST